MPLSVAAAFRLAVFLLMAAHVFFMYCLARSHSEHFGPAAATVAACAAFSLGMMLPLVWAVGVPELPEIYVRVVRARRWFRQKRCPECGYVRGDVDAGSACPECGAAFLAPKPYRLERRTVRRFLVMGLGAWLLGCASAELWITADEIIFRNEVRDLIVRSRSEPTILLSWARPRRWPANGTLVWDEAEGFGVVRRGLTTNTLPRN